MKRTICLILLTLVLKGCSNNYSIDKNSLELSYKIDHGFAIYQLEVAKFDSKNNPKEYDEKVIVHCVPNNQPSTERFNRIVPLNAAKLYRDSWKTQMDIAERNENKIDNNTNDEDMSKFIETELARDSIVKKYFPFEPDDEIYFTKTNKNYWWRLKTYASDDLKEFPYTFRDDVWYKIEFSNQSCYTDDFYFKFEKDGKVKTHHIEGNCGAAW